MRLTALGVNQKTISERWGISAAMLSEWQTGADDKLGLGLRIRLRDALGVPLDELLGLPPLPTERR
jgi:transcriptional regulator with XRE-family HTH domain